jgi:hypothetical protein
MTNDQGLLTNDQGPGTIHQLEMWRRGLAPEAIPSRLPHLSLAQVFDALSYFSDHQAEVQQWIERDRIPDNLIDPLMSDL